jgi:hypothetical protein
MVHEKHEKHEKYWQDDLLHRMVQRAGRANQRAVFGFNFVPFVFFVDQGFPK